MQELYPGTEGFPMRQRDKLASFGWRSARRLYMRKSLGSRSSQSSFSVISRSIAQLVVAEGNIQLGTWWLNPQNMRQHSVRKAGLPIVA